MTLSEWLNQYSGLGGVDYNALKPLVNVDWSGYSSPDWSFNPAPGDSGEKPGYSLTPEAAQRLSDYSVNEKSNDGDRTTYGVAGPGGFSGEVSTPIDKDSWFDKLGYAAPFLLGGAGLGGFLPGTESIFGGAAGAGAAEAGASAAGGGSSVNAALAELVGAGPQSMAFGSMASPAVTGALGELVGMSIPTIAQTFGAAEALAGLGSMAPVLGSALRNMPQATDLTPELTGTATMPEIPIPDLSKGLPLLNTAPPLTVPSVTPGAPPPNTPPASGIPDWLTQNGKWLAPLLGAGMGLLDGGGSSSGGYKDSGYRPTITRGGWSPSAAQAPTVTPNIGLLNIPTTGVENAGLWRFLGGQ